MWDFSGIGWRVEVALVGGCLFTWVLELGLDFCFCFGLSGGSESAEDECG